VCVCIWASLHGPRMHHLRFSSSNFQKVAGGPNDPLSFSSSPLGVERVVMPICMITHYNFLCGENRTSSTPMPSSNLLSLFTFLSGDYRIRCPILVPHRVPLTHLTHLTHDMGIHIYSCNSTTYSRSLTGDGRVNNAPIQHWRKIWRMKINTPTQNNIVLAITQAFS